MNPHPLVGPSSVQLAVDALSPAIRRLEIPLADFHPPDPRWLECAPFFPKFFWRPRRRAAALAACGEVWSGSLAGAARVLAGAAPGTRVLGGRAFHPRPAADSRWNGFPQEKFFVPRIEICAANPGAMLAVHLLPDETSESAAEEWIEAIAGQCEQADSFKAVARWDRPHFAQWTETVRRALEEIRHGGLEKAVLARHSCFELAGPASPFALLHALAGRAPDCFHFAFQPGPQSPAFLGASPELLFRRHGLVLESEAIAGTRGRSLDPSEDERMEGQLLGVDKERHEHRVVVEEIDRVFAKFCATHAGADQPGVLKLPGIQHLATPFRGTLRPGATDAELLDALHPTPATCGRPAPAARELLLRSECFDRGWYAGPLGVASLDSAEFCVAIRSAVLNGALLDAYAGAGIVGGSDPEKEWEELESKIAGLLHILEG